MADSGPLRVRQGGVAKEGRGRRLASRGGLLLADLRRETMPRWKGAPSPAGNEDVLPAGDGPEIVDVPQLIQMISVGRTIGMLPRSLVGPVPPDLVCVPVTDAAPSHIVVAWSPLRQRPVVTSFVEAAVAAGAPRRDLMTAQA